METNANATAILSERNGEKRGRSLKVDSEIFSEDAAAESRFTHDAQGGKQVGERTHTYKSMKWRTRSGERVSVGQRETKRVLDSYLDARSRPGCPLKVKPPQK